MYKLINKPAIAIIPYGKWRSFNLSTVSLDELEWPLGKPDRLIGRHIKDLSPNDHLITYPRKVTFLLPRPRVKAQISLMIVEPDVVHQKYLNWAYKLNWRFYKVLTKNKTLLANINNGEFYYFGSTFLKDLDHINRTKTKKTSLIASARNELKGHKLRHEIVSDIRLRGLNVDVMGRGYKPFNSKEEGLAPYYFSVIIENIQEEDYFSEKLVDACLCDTLPIYWGCPNIIDYFDTRGMVICNSATEIMNAIQNMSVDEYKSRKKWIKNNRSSAVIHANLFKRAALQIQNSL